MGVGLHESTPLHERGPVTEDRRTSIFLRKIFELWPLWVAVAGGITAGYQFYFTVKRLDEAQVKWQEGSEIRRERSRELIDSLDGRVTRLEADMKWITKEKCDE